jgi:NAD(P)-dependent dehydrogenase (short-subunit alcohol dehydrogenase family)
MRILVVGATGTIGTAVVNALASHHELLRAARTTADHAVDICLPDSIQALFETVGPLDAVVCAAGDARFAPMNAMSDADYRVGISSKLIGQVNLARIAARYLRDEGSITLTSGALGRRPIVGATSVSMVNSALEGYVRAAALELPRGLRVNVVSPQWTIETLRLYGMDESWGVPASTVALAYVESVEGALTGTVIDAGWLHDSTVGSASVAVAIG